MAHVGSPRSANELVRRQIYRCTPRPNKMTGGAAEESEVLLVYIAPRQDRTEYFNASEVTMSTLATGTVAV
jgi:hypothetical protein